MRHQQPTPHLHRRQLGVFALAICAVSASAPLTVLAGGVTTTFAVTGNAGVPLSFVLLGLALALFAVGYGAMSRYVGNAGAFYSYLSVGLGRIWGVSGSFVALTGYNAIQIGLYGLFGGGLADFAAQTLGITLPWYLWAFVAMIVVGLLGVLRVDLNASVLGVLLCLEIVAVIFYDIGGFTHPAGGVVSTVGLSPAALFGPGVGAVFALGVAAFIGFESAATYSEECRNPRITVARATFVAVGFTGLLYALSAWAMTVTVGATDLQAQATANGPGLVFGALAEHWGPAVADIANVQFLTSVFAALLSFHNVVARYLFALGREDVLPRTLSRVGRRSGGPVAGSLFQSALAAVVVALFAISGADPILAMFTWLSGVSAVAVVLLMLGTSLSVVGFFRSRPKQATTWQRLIAPGAAAVVLAALVILLIGNFDSLLGTDPTSPLRWILPGIVVLAAVAGAAWASYLRNRLPGVYRQIGRVALAPDDEPMDLPDLSRRR